MMLFRSLLAILTGIFIALPCHGQANSPDQDRPTESETRGEAHSSSAEPVFDVPPGYEPLERTSREKEEVSAVPLVVAAYMLIWGLLFGYLLLLWRRQAKMKKEMRELLLRLQEMSRE